MFRQIPISLRNLVTRIPTTSLMSKRNITNNYENSCKENYNKDNIREPLCAPDKYRRKHPFKQHSINRAGPCYVNFNVGRSETNVFTDRVYDRLPGWLRVNRSQISEMLLRVPENTFYIAYGDGSRGRDHGVCAYSTTIYRKRLSGNVPICDVVGTGIYSNPTLAEACAILAAIRASKWKIEVVTDCQVAIRNIFFTNEGGIYKEIRDHLIRQPGRIKISFMPRNSCQEMLRAHNNCNFYRKVVEDKVALQGKDTNTFFQRIDYMDRYSMLLPPILP